MVEKLADRIAGLWDRVLEEPREIVVFRLTLLLLLLYGADDPNVELGVRILVLPALLTRRLASHPAVWTALAALEFASCSIGWFGQDNHKFLIAYWTFACCLAA